MKKVPMVVGVLAVFLLGMLLLGQGQVFAGEQVIHGKGIPGKGSVGVTIQEEPAPQAGDEDAANFNPVTQQVPAVIEENPNDPQVYIEVKYLRVPNKTIKELGLSDAISGQGRLKKDEYLKLISAEGVQTIAGSAVLVKSGEEATIRLVTDKYLPQSWSQESFVISSNGALIGKAANPEKKSDAKTESTIKLATSVEATVTIPPVPQLGEPTEFGITMRVTPTVDADYKTIALDVLPVIQSLTGWTEYDGKTKMPIVSRCTIQAPLQTKDGEIVILTGTNSSSKEGSDAQILIAVNPSLVSTDGTAFVKKPETAEKRSFELEFTPINVGMQILEISSKNLLAVCDGKRLVGPAPQGFCKKLLDSGKAKLLAAPRLICQSGQEGCSNMKSETTYFPSSWTEPSVSSTEGCMNIIPPYPSLGEGTNTGEILTVTPTVNTNLRTIDLAMNPQFVALVGWTSYPYAIDILTASGNEKKAYDLKMPEISHNDVVTSVIVSDGETLCLGYTELGFDPMKDNWKEMTEFKDGKVIFYFVTATLVGPIKKENKSKE